MHRTRLAAEWKTLQSPAAKASDRTSEMQLTTPDWTSVGQMQENANLRTIEDVSQQMISN